MPRLVTDVNGQRELFDADALAEFFDWRLLDYPADLSRFAFDEMTRRYTLDLEGEVFQLAPLLEGSAQMDLLPSETTSVGLVSWLDPRLRDASISRGEKRAWLLQAVETTLGKPGFTMALLDRGRFLLLRLLRGELEQAKARAAAKGYNDLLFGPQTRVVTDGTEEWGFSFPREYTPASWCGPGYRFTKHYYHPGPGEMRNAGEEWECAQDLDRLGDVEFWVRNLAGKHRVHSSFWLQTSTDRFYPDFVAKLKGSGKILVVEYKGEAYRTNDDSGEKERLRQIWEERSGGRGVFAMVWKGRHARTLEEQLRAAIG